jgi:signal transduction histidine kinase
MSLQTNERAEIGEPQTLVACTMDPSSAVELVQAESERIAQELHDAAGQELAAAGLFAAGLQKMVARAFRRAQKEQQQTLSIELMNDDDADGHCGIWFDSVETTQFRETLAGLRRGIASAARNIRDLSHGLMLTELDPQELPLRLEELRENLEVARSIRCEVRCLQPGQPGYEHLNSRRALELLRIVQEAVSNAIRHGGADEIRVSLSGNNGYLELEVVDNGRGLVDANGEHNGHQEHNGSSEHASPGDHFGGIGLRNMACRARRIGGLLQVGNSSGGGMVVRCRVEPGGLEHG